MQTSNNKMWWFISLPILAYLVYVFYFHKITKQAPIPIAECVQLPAPIVKKYIQKYASLAQKEMQVHRIPASITLAQAILESNYGTSPLALQANNHFGIKADQNWSETDRFCLYSNEWIAATKKMKAILSCFRRYQNVAECYDNHSRFLVKKARYQPLFDLAITDYKQWAEGLRKAGYATDPQYSNKLIAVIEKYNLATFDKITPL